MLEDYAKKNGLTSIRHFTEIKYPYKWRETGNIDCKIYEDNALGKLSDKHYAMLYNQNEGGQEQLQSEFDGYKTEQAQYENDRRA